uniref:Uncharacterized protein n=1 Tax=Anguilla anguilla TaxID=7936 RepID=A0A0E9T3K9_ANGAN
MRPLSRHSFLSSLTAITKHDPQSTSFLKYCATLKMPEHVLIVVNNRLNLFIQPHN